MGKFKVFIAVIGAGPELERELKASRETANWISSGRFELEVAKKVYEKIDAEVEFPDSIEPPEEGDE